MSTTLARCPLCAGKLQSPWNLGEPWRCSNCGAHVKGPIAIERIEPPKAFL